MTAKLAWIEVKNIEPIVDEDCGITVAVIESYGCIAAAAENTHSVAMLRRKAEESLMDVLHRLDDAVATTRATGNRVDEVNIPATPAHHKLRSRDGNARTYMAYSSPGGDAQFSVLRRRSLFEVPGRRVRPWGFVR